MAHFHHSENNGIRQGKTFSARQKNNFESAWIHASKQKGNAENVEISRVSACRHAREKHVVKKISIQKNIAGHAKKTYEKSQKNNLVSTKTFRVLIVFLKEH